MTKKRLGIIAGSGSLPLTVAKAAINSGQDVYILGVEGEADDAIAQFPHGYFRWGQIGTMFDLLKRANCGEVVLIGGVSRPDLTKIKPDIGLVVNLPFIFKLTFGGDDSLLSRIVRFFEHKGFDVKGAHEIAPELLCQAGVLGRYSPRKKDQADISKAINVVQQMGRLDIGQGAIVSRSHVLAVEAAEGTDAMLARCKAMRQWGLPRRGGVLIKCPKPGQETRVDMPTIGPETVERAAKAGLRGIALAAGQVLIAERPKVIETADRLKLFVSGIEVSQD